MKQIFISTLGSAIALSLLFFITGCKKESSQSATESKTSRQIIDKVNAWLANQKSVNGVMLPAVKLIIKTGMR